MTEGQQERVTRFRALYETAYPRVTAYALRRARTREDALDVVSETMLTMWRRLDEIPEGDLRLAWVFGVARRVLANHYRAAGRRDRLTVRAAFDPVTRPGEFNLVHQALDALRPDQQEILTLSAWDDLDNHEIAAALGLTPGLVAVRLHRARRRMARELSRLGFTAGREDSVKSPPWRRTLDEVPGIPPGPGEKERA